MARLSLQILKISLQILNCREMPPPETISLLTASSARQSGLCAHGLSARDGVESLHKGPRRAQTRRDLYQPGAKTSNPTMPNDMVCHVPEGELRVKQSDGMEFVAKKGDVWTCKKGIGEDLENVGSTVAIMRICTAARF